MLKQFELIVQNNREMKIRRHHDLEMARRIRENRTMGKWKQNPKQNVMTFRADDTLAELIHAKARGYETLSQFLEEAVREKVQADRQRQMDEVIHGALRGM